MLTLVHPKATEAHPPVAEDTEMAASALPARDWSNVVFSPVFCEEARRSYEDRLAS